MNPIDDDPLASSRGCVFAVVIVIVAVVFGILAWLLVRWVTR